jgi:hypothetical protein
MTEEEAKLKIDKIEKDLTTVGGSTGVYWCGVEFEWEALPLSKGGKLKRGSTYGVINYICEGVPLVTKVDVIKEVLKPPELKQALKEAMTFVQCTMCGKIIVGKEAMEAFEDYLSEYKMVDGVCHIERTLKEVWCKFRYTYKPLYDARQLSRQLNKTADIFEKTKLSEQFKLATNKPLNYDTDRIEITLCPCCSESIYNGDFKKED